MRDQTQESNHFHAKHVIRQLNTTDVCGSMKGPTQEKMHLHALNEKRHFYNAVFTRYTKVPTLA